MKKFSFNNSEIHYSVHGKGKPVLFIHGAAASAIHGQYLKDYIVPAGYSMITYSQRFHLPNNPSAQGEYGAEQHSDDLIALIDHLQIDQVTAIGHSYGGMVLLNSAIKYSSRFKNIFLAEVSIPSLLSGDEFAEINQHRKATFDTIKKAFETGNSALPVRLLMNYAIGGAGFNVLPEDIQRDMIANTASLYHLVYNQVISNRINHETISSLHIPVDLLIGNHCTPIYREVATILLNTLPDAELFTIRSVAHDLIYNAAEDCVKIILSKM